MLRDLEDPWLPELGHPARPSQREPSLAGPADQRSVWQLRGLADLEVQQQGDQRAGRVVHLRQPDLLLHAEDLLKRRRERSPQPHVP